MSPERFDKVIFLDRDGVINFDAGKGDYVRSHKQFEFIPGSPEAVKKLNQAGFKVVIISNQAGVAKGLYSEEDLNKITEKMIKGIEDAGARIHSVNYCVHQDEDNCDCRKPKPGNIIKASRELHYDPKNTFIIGDSRRDIMAGRLAGLKTIFVKSGNTKLEDLTVKPDYVAEDLKDAVDRIVLKNS